ncbi:late embryogenesis abundant protein D-34 [Trifolium repens]|nr:late embryogenesis abundant protein D-34 [Trifolium repens]
MSHGQPNRLQEEIHNQEPIKFGDVFNVFGDLASETISPQAAATMAAVESRVFGQPQRGSPAAAMQAAAVINEAFGQCLVGRMILGRRVEPDAHSVPMNMGSAAIDGDPITIGEALEAAGLSAGDKPVDQNDADAISAAEIRATGEKSVKPGGVGASAQSAANLNSHANRREEMTKLSDVLTDATDKLVTDKAVTKEDADAVYDAEMQKNSSTQEMNNAEPGGVAASMATAAKLNQQT